jgi:hypothetical protein
MLDGNILGARHERAIAFARASNPFALQGKRASVGRGIKNEQARKIFTGETGGCVNVRRRLRNAGRLHVLIVGQER